MSQPVSSGDRRREALVTLVEGEATRSAVERACSANIGFDIKLAGGGIELRRVTWKPNRRLRAFYDVTINGVVVPITVRWEHEASTGIVEIWPGDRTWPHVSAALGEDNRRAALASVGWDGNGEMSTTVVRYRPGQRHVLRLSGDEGAVAFLKVGPPGSGAASAIRAQVLANACTLIGAQAPTPTWWSDDLGAVAAAGVSGQPLTANQTPKILFSVGALLAALHLKSSNMMDLPQRSIEQEASLTLRACEHIVALYPEVEHELQAIVETILSALKSRTAVPVLLHGDAKLDHFFVAGGSFSLIDLDSAAQGDPYYDLGRLIASLWWETDAQTASAAQTSIITGYFEALKESNRYSADDDSLEVWTALWVLKQAARRIPLFDPALLDRFIDAIDLARSLLTSQLRRM